MLNCCAVTFTYLLVLKCRLSLTVKTEIYFLKDLHWKAVRIEPTALIFLKMVMTDVSSLFHL